MQQNHKIRQTGLSLIELMVAVAIGMLVVLVILGLFITSNKNYIQDNTYTRMLESGRSAMKYLTRDIRMAGFWGRVLDTAAVTNTTGTPSICGVSIDAVNPVQIVNNATATTANTEFDCIATSDFRAGTDVLMIKRTQGVSTLATSATNNGNIYLRITGTSNAGDLIIATGAGTNADDNDWLFLPHIYYIKNKTVNGKTIPTLFRKSLADTDAIADDEIAEGIEDIQIQFGIDSDNDGDIDFYTPAPTTAQLAQTILVRVNILVRALTEDPNTTYANTKTYNLGEGAIGPFNDRFQRRVYTSTVPVRNVFSLNLS